LFCDLLRRISSSQLMYIVFVIDNGGRLIAKLYDKSDDFTFPTKLI
jgi:hypothetical protein